MSETAIIESIDTWLTTKQTVLWGSTWDVTSPARRRLAAEWFHEQMAAWLTEHKKHL
jgi:hypothetical protein